MGFTAMYHDFKEQLAGAAGENHALLHVNIGLAIYLLFQVVMGTRRGSLPTFALLAAFVACNIVMNRLYFGSWRIGISLQEMALTLLWPTLLIMAGHFRRWRWRAAQPRVKPRFALSLVPAPPPVATKTAIPTPLRQPPRLRVFPGYIKRGPA